MTKREVDKDRYARDPALSQKLTKKFGGSPIRERRLIPTDGERDQIKSFLAAYEDLLMSPDGEHISLERFLGVLGNRIDVCALMGSRSHFWLQIIDLLDTSSDKPIIDKFTIIAIFTRYVMAEKFAKNYKPTSREIDATI